MIHHDTINYIRHQCRHNDFLQPFYGNLSIAEVVPTILKLFGVESERATLPFPELYELAKDRQKVVMLMLDGFSYKHFIKYNHRYPTLKNLAKRGHLYPITSVFPSTTPAALTCLHTGLTPQEHGLPEWTVYFEEFDEIIETLPFKTWAMNHPDGLLEKGGDPTMLYNGPTVYQQLRRHDIKSYNFIYHHYAHSVYSRAVHNGSVVVPFEGGDQLMQLLKKILTEEEGPCYAFVYWGFIDSTAHDYGPDTPEHIQAMNDFFGRFEEQFLKEIDPAVANDVLLMLTADHGQVNIKGEDIINLNQYSEIDKSLAYSSNGKRILPTGSPHDVFLFVDPPKVDSVINFLRDELVGRAEVMTIDDAIALGLFGLNQPTETFRRRIGNVIILPYTHHHVWYEFFPEIPYRLLGIHGGLSEDEMIVPLAFAPLNELTQ